MSPSTPVGENDLHAYLDGALDEDARAEIEAWLAGHPDDDATTAAWRRQRDGLRALYDGILEEPVPPGMLARLAESRPGVSRRAWLRAAAGIALFAAGAAAGWGVHDRLTPPGLAPATFISHAVKAHVVFTAERRHAAEARADTEEKHLIRWLSKRLGQPVRPPPLAELGFRLIGGRLVADAAGPAAQYMYQDKSGRRVTLYVRRESEARYAAFRFASEGGLSAFYWIDSPLSYAVIGRMEREELLKLARMVYRKLGS